MAKKTLSELRKEADSLAKKQKEEERLKKERDERQRLNKKIFELKHGEKIKTGKKIAKSVGRRTKGFLDNLAKNYDRL